MRRLRHAPLGGLVHRAVAPQEAHRIEGGRQRGPRRALAARRARRASAGLDGSAATTAPGAGGGAARRARSNGTRGATEYAAGGAYGKNVATLDMALSPGEYTLYVTQPLPLPKEVHARLPCFAFDLEVSPI